MNSLSLLLIFGGLAVIIPVNIPLYKGVFKMFFKTREEFKDSLQYMFMSDIRSITQGKLIFDLKTEIKIPGFFVFCVMIFLVEVQVIEKLFYLFVK